MNLKVMNQAISLSSKPSRVMYNGKIFMNVAFTICMKNSAMMTLKTGRSRFLNSLKKDRFSDMTCNKIYVRFYFLEVIRSKRFKLSLVLKPRDLPFGVIARVLFYFFDSGFK